MQWVEAGEIKEIALEIEAELKKLERLAADVARGKHELRGDPERADIHYSNLAFKLHNFYTGCERIFCIIASELDHTLPSSYDRHKRLLGRMVVDVEGTRPAVITEELRRELEEFLSFRCVVRNLGGHELDPKRIERPLGKYPPTWIRFNDEIARFVEWMHQLAADMEVINGGQYEQE